MASIIDTKNLSIYTIPAAWAIAYAPHAYACYLAKTVYDPRSPRSLNANLQENQTLTQETKERIIRAASAHANGLENLSLYASAIVAANVARLPAKTLNLLSGGYLLSRLIYSWIYINNTTVKAANARSAMFFSGLGVIFTLFVKVGNMLRERGVGSL